MNPVTGPKAQALRGHTGFTSKGNTRGKAIFFL